MDSQFEQFYRDVFSDLTVDREEFDDLKEYFEKANPPPDKLVWLRATAFRIGSEFLSEGDKDSDVSLLRCINATVHALEQTCMQPKDDLIDEELAEDFEPKFEEFYREIYSDLTVDREESQELMTFLSETPPPVGKLVWVRAATFRIGSEFLTDEKETNVSLLRCINVIVHLLEHAYMKPKLYKLHIDPPEEISVQSVGMDASIEKAIQYLWDLDMNRLTPDKDYVLNVQKGKKPHQDYDAAREPLFTKVDTTVFRRPTYKTFIALLDNYSPETGIAELVNSAERREIWNFLDAIMQTAPMQFCHKYCSANSSDVPSDQEEFKKLLYKIWFDLYKRSYGGRPDSSGFEHVFVGEIKNGKISGFHNWIQFYLEEKKGTVGYRGYIKPRSKVDAATDSNDHTLTLQFTWHGVEKFVGGGFIGVSPEFEMALYTTCFLVGKEENIVELNTGTDVFDINIKCFCMARDKIGTSFPIILSHEEA